MRSARAALALGLVCSMAACGDRVLGDERTTDTVSSIDPFDGPAADCPQDHPREHVSTGIVEYGDFVQLRGRLYDRVIRTTLSPDSLGAVVGEVCFTLSDTGVVPLRPRDGDASFLPVGTTLHRFSNADPRLRVAAITGAGVVVYEVGSVDEARTAADVIDITDDIVAIGINSDEDNSTIASITDRGTVASLIDALAAAPIVSAHDDAEREGPRYFVELHRSDGTTTTRPYWIETGELWPNIDLPSSWRAAIDTALGPHPPTTIPGTTTPVGTVPSSTLPLIGPEVDDETVRHVALALGVEGPIEHRAGEHGVGQSIGRLEPRGLSVNVPVWGYWQYWDIDAQDGAGATDDQAAQVAIELFRRLGFDPGTVRSVEPNGPLPQVMFTGGASVMVAADGRIAMLLAPTSLPTVAG